MGILNRKKQPIDYDFQAINPVDFKLTIKLPCDNRIFQHILTKTKHKMQKKGYNTDNIKELKTLTIDQRYYGLITTHCTSIIKQIKKEIEDDGISWQSYNLHKAIMEKGTDKWIITLTFTGTYIDNRNF